MDDILAWVLFVMVIIAAIWWVGAQIVLGIVGLYNDHRLPFIAIIVVVLVIVVVVLATPSTKSEGAPDAEVILVKTKRARSSLVETRQKIEHETAAIRSLNLGSNTQTSFEYYCGEHHKSRLLADQWYRHKQGAIELRDEFANGLAHLSSRGRRLRSTRGRNAREIAHIASVSTALQSAITDINAEIARGRSSLNACNIETARLRDHIGAHCGERGRRWFNDLQERKRKS